MRYWRNKDYNGICQLIFFTKKIAKGKPWVDGALQKETNFKSLLPRCSGADQC